NGTSRRIEELPEAGGAVVFGPTPDGQLTPAMQTAAYANGEQDCVALVLQDGRELVCTADHAILRADGQWVRADQLVPGEDRVVVGLESPTDEPGADEAGYALRAGGMTFTMSGPHERLRTLAFARLLGHLLGDGSISVAGQGRMNVGQAVDREAVLNDIDVVTSKRPSGMRYDERKWSIVLPSELTRAVVALPGVRVGRRIDQAPRLPDFVLEASCPVAVVREFLGGVLGADGTAPVLKRLSPREGNPLLARPAYSQTSLVMRLARFARLPTPADRKFRPLHRASCGFPSPVETLREIGVRDWFAPLCSRAETPSEKRYCVEKDATTLPTMALKVLERRRAGKRRVFDLSVEGVHSFVAGTVGVHNCIGNSGPLPEAVAEAVTRGELVAAAVLSGNRNFEGRINPLVRANYLASPPL